MTIPTPPTDPLAPLLARLQRLEETQAFTEHAHDALTDQINDLHRRVADTTARLARLEERLVQLGEDTSIDNSPDEPG